MYAPSLHKWHAFDQGIAFVRQHRIFAEAVLAVALIGLMYNVAVSLNDITFPEIGRIVERSTLVSGDVEALTRFTDPAYAQEYAQREAYIVASLERFLEVSQVERAYAIVYRYGESTAVVGLDTMIQDVFEVSQPYIAPRFKNLKGMTRSHWLQTQQDDRMLRVFSHNVFQSYGIELQNERGAAIAHIGFERKQDDVPFRDRDVAQLRKTAERIKQGLLQPLETLEL